MSKTTEDATRQTDDDARQTDDTVRQTDDGDVSLAEGASIIRSRW